MWRNVEKLDVRKETSHICTVIICFTQCQSKIMTQGFKMRAQPLSAQFCGPDAAAGRDKNTALLFSA